VEELPVEEPAADELPVDEPAADELPVEEPAVEELPVEELPVEEPAVEEPAVEEPAADELPAEEPAAGAAGLPAAASRRQPFRVLLELAELGAPAFGVLLGRRTLLLLAAVQAREAGLHHA
jgi:hypothetical protein